METEKKVTNRQRVRWALRLLDRKVRCLIDPWHQWRLARRRPALADLSEAIAARAHSLQEARCEYVSSVSKDAMAASAQYCALVQEVSCRLPAGRIADLGSGFSSFALRSLAASRSGLEIWTADDDAAWLETTKNFLRRKRLSTDRCYIWSDLAERPDLKGTFDVVAHDLGHSWPRTPPLLASRAAYLDEVLDLVKPGGVVVLDDVHAAPFRDQARAILRNRGLSIYPMVASTIDHFRRYSWLVLA